MHENDTDGTPRRAQMAKSYLEADYNLDRQEKWYSDKATANKSWHHWLGLIVLAGGAGTSFVQVWAPSATGTDTHWVTVVTAFLGALVVLAKGIERIWDFDGSWSLYRKASENIKRERRLFINGAALYSKLTDDDQAYSLFVERVEEIIAAEQKTFWGAREIDQGDAQTGKKKG